SLLLFISYLLSEALSRELLKAIKTLFWLLSKRENAINKKLPIFISFNLLLI
ncbi:36412_t:CDS:2, partial [Racocetra persica]